MPNFNNILLFEMLLNATFYWTANEIIESGEKVHSLPLEH